MKWQDVIRLIVAALAAVAAAGGAVTIADRPAVPIVHVEAPPEGLAVEACKPCASSFNNSPDYRQAQ